MHVMCVCVRVCVRVSVCVVCACVYAVGALWGVLLKQCKMADVRCCWLHEVSVNCMCAAG